MRLARAESGRRCLSARSSAQGVLGVKATLKGRYLPAGGWPGQRAHQHLPGESAGAPRVVGSTLETTPRPPLFNTEVKTQKGCDGFGFVCFGVLAEGSL